MFSDCLSLTSINLTNIDTSNVINMVSMFNGCKSLTSLDLFNFNTEKVTNMNWMFAYCESLTSLDLSSFNIAKVTSMNNIFNSCINLKYIHLDNFEKNRLSSSVNVFNDIPENAIVCIKDINSQSKILSNLKNVKICYSIDCTEDLASKQKKLNDNNYIDNKCNEICDKSSKYKYEYNGKCYADCEKGFLYDENNNQMNKCKCHLDL